MAAFAVAAILITAFLLIEHRVRDPLIPLRIFSNRGLSSADVTMLAVAAGMFGMFFFCTLYLQQVLGYNALKTGVAFLPISLAIITASSLVDASRRSRCWSSACSVPRRVSCSSRASTATATTQAMSYRR